MALNPIALAVPVFFVAIGVELIIAKRMGRKVYRFADAITNLSCGVTNQVVAVIFGVALLAAYACLHDHFRLVTPPVWAQWAIDRKSVV